MRLVLLFSLLLTCAFGSSKNLTAFEIVRRADEARYPKGPLTFTVKVSDQEGTSSPQETSYLVHTEGNQNALVETREPARLRGRKLLMRENDLWLYLPDLKRPTRIGFEQRLTGEVSNGDLARTSFAVDYKAKLLGIEKQNEKVCFKLLLTSRLKNLAYRKMIYWIERSTFFPVKMKFFALSGKLLKTGEYSDPQLILGKKRVTTLVIQDALQNDKLSRLSYSAFKKGSFSPTFFSKEALGE